MVASISSVYADVSSMYPKEYIDYDNIILSKLNWTSQDYIRIKRYIDSGRFSTVFEGKMSKSYFSLFTFPAKCYSRQKKNKTDVC
jgi:hypothetical protein